MGKSLALISFKYGVSGYYSLQFSLRFFYNPYLFACKCIPHAKYEKKNKLKYQFLCFFSHNIGPTLAQIFPQRPHPLYFFWLIFNEIC